MKRVYGISPQDTICFSNFERFDFKIGKKLFKNTWYIKIGFSVDDKYTCFIIDHVVKGIYTKTVIELLTSKAVNSEVIRI